MAEKIHSEVDEDFEEEYRDESSALLTRLK